MKTESIDVISGPPHTSGLTRKTTTNPSPTVHTAEEIFQIARALPCYRKLVSEARCFNQAPIIDKDTLYEMVAECYGNAEFRKGLYLSPTGASTSPHPIYFPTDVAENHFQRSILSSYLNRAEILSEKSIVLNLFGSTMMYRSLEILNEFCEAASATVLPVSAHCPDDVAFNVARQFSANCIVGTSSRIVQFAKFMQDNKLLHPFGQIIFAGEPLPPYKERFLQQTLKTSSFCALFGSGEAGVFGFKQSDSDGAKYFCPPELVHIEVVDADKDGFGTMILTNLIRTRFPLLRYNSGDIVRLSKVLLGDKEMNLIEFRSRADKSFQIGGEYVMLSEYSELFAGLLDFQISLTYEPALKMDKITFQLVAREQPDQSYQTYVANGINEITKSDPKLFQTTIEFVGMDKLTKSPYSQKIAKIIDNR